MDQYLFPFSKLPYDSIIEFHSKIACILIAKDIGSHMDSYCIVLSLIKFNEHLASA